MSAAKEKGRKEPRFRLDELLVKKGLAPSLTEAKALIMAGQVLVQDQRVDKPGSLIRADLSIRVKDTGRFVSRGGEKLAHALTDLGLTETMRGSIVLDVGASTGGFTHCCLSLGAKHVIALDVGSNQLAWELRQDPRVTVLEQTDIRAFDPSQHPAVNFVVADVSFNSLARLAPALRRAAPGTHVPFVLLVKPQFELPKEKVPSGGVVENEDARQEAVALVRASFFALGFSKARIVDSRIPGKTGNREIFLCLEPS